MNASLIRTELVYNLAPRYIRRWFVVSLLLIIPFFATFHRGTTDANSTGTHPTSWSWVILVVWAFLTLRMIVLVVYYRHHGRPANQASNIENVVATIESARQKAARTGRPVVVATQRPKTTSSSSAAPTAPQQPLTVVHMSKARSSEDHGSFVVTDRRRFAHLVDE